MECKEASQLIEARLDGERIDEVRLQRHLSSCARCSRRARQADGLSRALRSLSLEGPTAGFADRALAVATGETPRRRHTTWWLSAVAASLVVGLALGILLGTGQLGPGGSASAMSHVRLTAGEGAQPVNLVFNAPHDLKGVQLTLQVDGDVEIDGFGHQRTLTWTTDLAQGRNLLTLPVRPGRVGHAELIARLDHEGLRRTFRVRVDVAPDGSARLDSGVVPSGGDSRV